jgi:hypothetical protein
MLAGDWGRVRGQIETLHAITPTAWAYLPRCLLEIQLGNFEAAKTLVEVFYEANRTLRPGRMMGSTRTAAPTSEIGLLGLVAGFADWVGPTHDQFERVSVLVREALGTHRVRPWVLFQAQSGEAFAAIARHDAVAAEGMYEAIAPRAGIATEGNPFAVDHMLGLLAATTGRVEIARSHLEAALAFYRSAGWRPSYGWAAADYSDLLFGRNGQGDHAQSLALGNEALVIGRELGMGPLIERVLARREILRA